jgi:AcrR family transcriptional regulator
MSFEKDFEHSQELFDYALEEFSMLGYEQASINAILEKAGMSKGQFYYHFKSKEDLYLALIDEVITRKKAFMARGDASSGFRPGYLHDLQDSDEARYGLCPGTPAYQ